MPFKDKTKKNTYNREWYVKNKDRLKVYHRKWCKKWRDTHHSTWSYWRIKQGAKSRNIFFDLTKEQVVYLVTQTCKYCGSKEKLGIDRLNSSVGYIIENCAPCCAMCNRAKSVLSVEEFKQHISTIYNYWIRSSK